MSVEQKISGRSLRHPFQRDVWAPVEIAPDQDSNLTEVVIGENQKVVLSALGDATLARLDSVSPDGNRHNPLGIWGNEDINDAPFFDKLRFVKP